MSYPIPDTHPAGTESLVPVAPTRIEALCAAAVDRLAQALPPRTVVTHYPDRPEEFDFEGSDAAALVLYEGSRFDEAGLAGARGAREFVRLTVVLLVRALAGDGGAYRLIEATRAALHGQALAGATGLRPVEVALDRQDAQVFQFRVSFEAALPAIPGPARAPILPLPTGVSA
jgi:hypothetical protein